MVYGNKWVAYMYDDTRAARKATYSGYNFLGTVEWAIDLEEFTGDIDDDFTWDCPNAADYSDLDDISSDSSIPTSCLNYYIMYVMAQNLTSSLQTYTNIMADGYTKQFTAYSTAVEATAPNV
jgi:chitinase